MEPWKKIPCNGHVGIRVESIVNMLQLASETAAIMYNSLSILPLSIIPALIRSLDGTFNVCAVEPSRYEF
jgi:hypothetical protein